MNSDITNQPVFYLFIAFTVLLTLGYSWGRRRNQRILRSALNGLADVINPRDQKFTNIGGQTGFHVNFWPKKSSVFHQVDATITLLPRQSWLYYPFALLFRKFDRLFLSLELKKQPALLLSEGHLIEKGYSRLAGASISNADRMQKEELDWGAMRFTLYWENDDAQEILRRVLSAFPDDPGPIRHIALVPERERIFLFLIPRYGTVKDRFAKIYGLISSFYGERMNRRKGASS